MRWPGQDNGVEAAGRGGLVSVRANRPGKHQPGVRRDHRADRTTSPLGRILQVAIDVARERRGGSRIPRACDGGWSGGHSEPSLFKGEGRRQKGEAQEILPSAFSLLPCLLL